MFFNKFLKSGLANGIYTRGAGIVVDEIVVYFLEEIIVIFQNRSYFSQLTLIFDDFGYFGVFEIEINTIFDESLIGLSISHIFSFVENVVKIIRNVFYVYLFH